MKIIFDFDHTLFNMSSMHDDINVAMESLGITPEQYQSAYNEVTYWKMFNVDALANRLERLYHVEPRDVRFALDNLSKRSDLYVYDDVHSHLNDFKKQGHELFLLSWGDQEWQKSKISNCGIDHHFEDVVTVSHLKTGYLENLCCESKGIVLIDDKPAELKQVKEMNNSFHLIRIKRPNGRYSDQPTPSGVLEATSMKEVSDIINNLTANQIAVKCKGCKNNKSK